MIFIVTGPIRSGKSTTLYTWCVNQDMVDGVLCLDNSIGKRYFLNIQSKEEYILETDANAQDEMISVGKFHLLQAAFDSANLYVKKICNKAAYKYLIIDELGKLELKNNGLHEAAESVILRHETDVIKHIILVVRDSLLTEIISHYNISNYSVITKADLNQLN